MTYGVTCEGPPRKEQPLWSLSGDPIQFGARITFKAQDSICWAESAIFYGNKFVVKYENCVIRTTALIHSKPVFITLEQYLPLYLAYKAMAF